jgi:hypothetical protein
VSKTPSGWQVKARLEGVEQTARELRAFPPRLQRKWIRLATTKGAQIFAKTAKATVPTESKQYKRAVGYKVWVGRKTGKVAAFIGARLGHKTMYKGKPRDPRYYAHIVEGGRKSVKPKKKSVLAHVPLDRDQTQLITWYGKHVRAARPQRPLARSFRQSKGGVEATMVAVLKQGVEAGGK